MRPQPDSQGHQAARPQLRLPLLPKDLRKVELKARLRGAWSERLSLLAWASGLSYHNGPCDTDRSEAGT